MRVPEVKTDEYSRVVGDFYEVCVSYQTYCAKTVIYTTREEAESYAEGIVSDPIIYVNDMKDSLKSVSITHYEDGYWEANAISEIVYPD